MPTLNPPETPAIPSTPQRREHSLLEHWPYLYPRLTPTSDSDPNSSPVTTSSPLDIAPPAPAKRKNVCVRCSPAGRVNADGSPIPGIPPCTGCGLGGKERKNGGLFAGMIGPAKGRKGTAARVLWEVQMLEERGMKGVEMDGEEDIEMK